VRPGVETDCRGWSLGVRVLVSVIEAANSMRWGRNNFIVLLPNRMISEDIKDCETKRGGHIARIKEENSQKIVRTC